MVASLYRAGHPFVWPLQKLRYASPVEQWVVLFKKSTFWWNGTNTQRTQRFRPFSNRSTAR